MFSFLMSTKIINKQSKYHLFQFFVIWLERYLHSIPVCFISKHLTWASYSPPESQSQSVKLTSYFSPHRITLRLKSNARYKGLNAASGWHQFLPFSFLTCFLLNNYLWERGYLAAPYLAFDEYICFLELSETDSKQKGLTARLSGAHRLAREDGETSIERTGI